MVEADPRASSLSPPVIVALAGRRWGEKEKHKFEGGPERRLHQSDPLRASLANRAKPFGFVSAAMLMNSQSPMSLWLLPGPLWLRAGRRTGRKVWVSSAAAGREVRAGAVGGAHGAPRGGVDPRPAALGHDGEVGVGVDQAGDERLVPGQRLKRPWRRRKAVGAAGADVVELVLRGKNAVLQWEGAMVVAPLAAPHGRRGLTQAAVDAVSEAELGHGRLVCAARTGGAEGISVIQNIVTRHKSNVSCGKRPLYSRWAVDSVPVKDTSASLSMPSSWMLSLSDLELPRDLFMLRKYCPHLCRPASFFSLFSLARRF
ncbi:hypothetical protein EYF80_006542 [Liparis tanakae]|uniref:Uncharacterized protein n=1 Tax=Liparis tanakae TaxID=230148 RepID=A0A4Z2IYZ1_9TELE|nr:hypothetical protein EYF80_006542 [Liparis tanakae]